MNPKSCLCEGIEGRLPASRKSERSCTRTSSRGCVARSGEKVGRVAPAPSQRQLASLIDHILTSTFLTELVAILLSAAGFFLTFILCH